MKMKKKSVSKGLKICLCTPFSSMSNHQKCFLQRHSHGFVQFIQIGMIPLHTGAVLTRKINSIPIQINYSGFLLYWKKSYIQSNGDRHKYICLLNLSGQELLRECRGNNNIFHVFFISFSL